MDCQMGYGHEFDTIVGVVIVFTNFYHTED